MNALAANLTLSILNLNGDFKMSRQMRSFTKFFVAMLLACLVLFVPESDAQGGNQQQDEDPDTNQSPQEVGGIPEQTITLGSSVDIELSSYFSDPDGDHLTYSATSDSTAVATVSVASSTLTITPVAVGTTSISATASDPHSESATHTIPVTVVAPNQAPTTVGTISDQTLDVGGSPIAVDVSGNFSDPDGDTLTYTASSSATTIATVSVSSATVTVTAVAAGSATITVTATDPDGLTVEQTFSVTVSQPNRQPKAVGTIPDQVLAPNGSAATIELAAYFYDPDEDTLTYTAASNDTEKVTVSISGSILTLTPDEKGKATVTVDATDPDGESATQDIFVSVETPPAAPVPVGTLPPLELLLEGSGTSITPDPAFSDPNGDDLTYSATSSDTAVVTINAQLIVSAVAVGTATITITATDPGGLSATQSFSVTVTANSAPTPVGTIPAQVVATGGGTASINARNYFSDADGHILGITASSSDTTVATVSETAGKVTITGNDAGTATITVTATDDIAAPATQTFTVTASNPPTTVGTIPNQTSGVGWGTITVGVSSYFSDPGGQTLSYGATSSDTGSATVSVSSSDVKVFPISVGTVTITVTATNTDGLSVSSSFTVTLTANFADAIPGLSADEISQLGALLTYDALIFHELHNASDDANDWLEIRNVSGADIPLDDWGLSVLTGEGRAELTFPAGAVIPAGEVLLLVNTEPAMADASVSSVVSESFALPQSDFALILSSLGAFGDIAGNYFEGDRPETAPALTADAVWHRTRPIASGYRAESWAVSTYQNGLGTPGYLHPSAAMDMNNDGVVNIFDLVLVASQFGQDGASAADLNGDGVVSIADLVLVADAFGSVAGAPGAGRTTTGMAADWLRLAREGGVGQSSIAEGFSYERGIAVLEQLARAVVPETTALLANYPNPFNPETWMPYQLAKPADVTLSIHSSNGSLIRTMELGHQPAGMYHNRNAAAYWDGANDAGETVASGIYFYTLTAGAFSATRKMLILK